MIDSHCHLDLEPLFEDITSVIKRSKETGLTKLLTISTTLKSYEKIINLINLDPIIFGTFGIHPHETTKNPITKELIINKISSDPKIIGVGETGLDFFYNNSDKECQIRSFKLHIEAAIYLNLPLIIHSRNAEDATFEILNSYKNQKPKILMHCFTGSSNFAKKLLDLGSFFSASGIITFKNSLDLQETFKNIPNDKIMIETDSPFLAPIPMRGKKNEPSYIRYTLEKLSELKKISFDDAQNLTTKNFNSLFFNN
tara:strand:+ start:77 stop:841 length:765 start_codon:yes stop_codon:yes gene_type:complete